MPHLLVHFHVWRLMSRVRVRVRLMSRDWKKASPGQTPAHSAGVPVKTGAGPTLQSKR